MRHFPTFLDPRLQCGVAQVGAGTQSATFAMHILALILFSSIGHVFNGIQSRLREELGLALSSLGPSQDTIPLTNETQECDYEAVIYAASNTGQRFGVPLDAHLALDASNHKFEDFAKLSPYEPGLRGPRMRRIP